MTTLNVNLPLTNVLAKNPGRLYYCGSNYILAYQLSMQRRNRRLLAEEERMLAFIYSQKMEEPAAAHRWPFTNLFRLFTHAPEGPSQNHSRAIEFCRFEL